MLSGGKLLDQGLYGCVFVPSLKCESGTEKRLSNEEQEYSGLSKLIPEADANQEFEISKRIHRIPFYKQYFAVTEVLCKPAIVQKEPDMKDCNIIHNEKLGDMRLLRMPYSGKPLHQATLSTNTFQLRSFATHLIAGGALMNVFGVVHRDLHQGNVLIDSHNVPRIIDFNLSIPVRLEKVKVSDLSHKYDVGISQEPPDSTLVNAIAHGESALNVIHSICFKKPIIHKIVSILGISKKEMYTKLIGFYKKSKSMRTGDMERWFSLYYRVIDSWAIGIIIVELIMKLSLWPSFASKIQGDVKHLIPILRKMCAVHPMERIDCVQALQMMDPNHIVIRRYSKKWLEIVGSGQK